jgi:hypothetical protein
LRKGKDKSEVTVYDVHSNLKYGKKHFSDRKKYYKEAKYDVTDIVKVGY